MAKLFDAVLGAINNGERLCVCQRAHCSYCNDYGTKQDIKTELRKEKPDHAYINHLESYLYNHVYSQLNN